MKLQIPLKYSDSFVSLQNNWGECAGPVRLVECGSMNDDLLWKKVLLECWRCSGWQQQRSAGGLSGAFSEQCVCRLSYVCFCGPSPMGNWYLCSEQAQHRARTISLHTAIWWGHFAVFWEQPLRKHLRNWSRSWCESSFGMSYSSSSSIPSIGRTCRL
jgi:hypothetical protein